MSAAAQPAPAALADAIPAGLRDGPDDIYPGEMAAPIAANLAQPPPD
jgi:hypothetical protein